MGVATQRTRSCTARQQPAVRRRARPRAAARRANSAGGAARSCLSARPPSRWVVPKGWKCRVVGALSCLALCGGAVLVVAARRMSGERGQRQRGAAPRSSGCARREGGGPGADEGGGPPARTALVGLTRPQQISRACVCACIQQLNHNRNPNRWRPSATQVSVSAIGFAWLNRHIEVWGLTLEAAGKRRARPDGGPARARGQAVGIGGLRGRAAIAGRLGQRARGAAERAAAAAPPRPSVWQFEQSG
jgi:hypothetical protein